MDIKWKDTDPETGERRYLKAEKFAGKWRFLFRRQRRDVTWEELAPTRAMWEYLLECLERRYRRREGVDDDDLAVVQKVLRAWRDPPEVRSL